MCGGEGCWSEHALHPLSLPCALSSAAVFQRLSGAFRPCTLCCNGRMWRGQCSGVFLVCRKINKANSVYFCFLIRCFPFQPFTSYAPENHITKLCCGPTFQEVWVHKWINCNINILFWLNCIEQLKTLLVCHQKMKQSFPKERYSAAICREWNRIYLDRQLLFCHRVGWVICSNVKSKKSMLKIGVKSSVCYLSNRDVR